MKPILLVEDNPDDIELTKLAFKLSNITNPLVVAHDGQEALDFVFRTGAYADRDASDQPVVILLDLKLPKLSGHEVLERIRADPRTSRIPIVILTTSDDAGDRANAADFHANSYVRKPVDFDAFTSIAKQLGLYWTVLNEPAP